MIAYKKVDRGVLEHPRERRGFVSVPLDHAKAAGEKIDIFYRLLPAYDGTARPMIVIFNGGPGVSCSAYRPLDFDYADPASPKNGPLDRFKYILNTHRVLLI